MSATKSHLSLTSRRQELGLSIVDHEAAMRERRRRPRMKIEQSVKLYDPLSDRYFAGHTCDVSETGLQLKLPAKLPAIPGRTACLYIAAPDAHRRLVSHTAMTPVRFVWVRRDARDGSATCGVEILAETAAARSAA